nr:hypothetical protein [Staphylococcus aureus]
MQFDTHLGLHFHFLYSKTELLRLFGAILFIIIVGATAILLKGRQKPQ